MATETSTAAAPTVTPVLIGKDTTFTTIDKKHKPVATIKPDTVIAVKTSDASYAAWHKSKAAPDHKDVNLVTGPIFVEGAEVGDALIVEVIKIDIESAWALDMGDHDYDPQPLKVSVDGKLVYLTERLPVSIEPMIGTIAVASDSEEAMSTLAPCYQTGGNMDLKEICPGSTVLFPVQVPGALLFLGDLHAAMGQGEPAGAGIEAAGTVTLRVGLAKGEGKKLEFPRIFQKDGTIVCIGMGDSMPEASWSAKSQALEVLARLGLSFQEAGRYIAAKLSLRFGGPAHNIVLAAVPPPVFMVRMQDQ